MTKYILTVDGGGIKGIIPCYILSEIEKQINKPLSQVFDLMSGSSVGAILIAALNVCDAKKKPIYNSEDILNLLLDYGPVIFKKSLLRNITSLFSGPRYSSKVLENIIEEFFKDALFGESIKPVIIPSYNLSYREPHMFKSWVNEFKTTKVTDILMATTAAPTYFSPKKIKITETDYSFIDGGIVANNPVVCAYAAAKQMFPNEDLCFLSIGCGKNKININQKYNRYGSINWLKDIIDIIFDADIEVVNYQMKRVVGHHRYFRVSNTLGYSSFALDNVSPENLNSLKLDAKKAAELHKHEIDIFCQLLMNNKNLVEKSKEYVTA